MGDKNYGVGIFALLRVSSGDMGKGHSLGIQKNPKNYFWWYIVVTNLPGTGTYECCNQWVYKDRRDVMIVVYLFVCVHYRRPIGPKEGFSGMPQ